MSKHCDHCHHAHEEAHEHDHEHEHDHDHEHAHGHTHAHSHEHGHDHGHDHGGEEENRTVMIVRIIASAALLAAGLLLSLPTWAKIALFLLSWVVVGYNVVIAAAENILHGHALDEMFLMTVASVGAFCLGDFAEGVAVMLLYQIGEFFQDYAVDQSRDSIAELMDIRPDTAEVERNGKIETVHPQQVNVGEIIVVRPGEKIPLDGTVIEGASALNTLALTGESAPRDVGVGDPVISGCVNMQGVLRIEATHAYSDSTVARILELVENAGDHKSRADQFITRFARIYTPVVVGLAVLVALIPPLFFGGAWKEWITSALTFLVISCPCALVISVPLTFFSAIGGASKRGILIKGANYVETLAQTGVAVFDKTGTLTQGAFAVTEIHPEGVTEQALLSLAAAAEQFSTHPIAQALLSACAGDLPKAEDAAEVAGHGVLATIQGKRVAVGNGKMMIREGVAYQPAGKAGTVVYAAADGQYLGYILISDALKAGAKAAIDGLKQLNVGRTVMLTGDSEAAAREVSDALQLDEMHAGLLPDGKVDEVERLMNEKDAQTALVFVGDGINDAPVLARADVGVAMGALGSDAAIEAADVVLMDDDPRKLPQAIRMARATVRIVRQNILFSLAVKVIVMILGVLHVAPLWLAIFADVGVCFLAILNAMRAMHIRD
ncbi:MAG: cadmium-translocating P-type ATPase [Clostridia bacterium]|nr:cadmium-translocating P-type ATPase [Clostridia bacterium]